MTAPATTDAWRRFDATRLLCVFVLLLFLIPANLTVPVFGAAGSPASLFGDGLFLVWILGRLRGTIRPARIPLRWGLGFFAAAVVASYIVLALRPALTVERSGGDRELLTVMGWAGVLLISMDGLRTREALLRVIRFVVACSAVMAAVGLIQYLTPFDPASYIKIPGLHPNSNLSADETRSGFVRAWGTASHPIEFSVVLATTFCLAIALATRSELTKVQRRRWVGAAAVIGFAIPIAVARSGFVALGVSLLATVPTWPKRWRRRFYVLLPLCVVGARLAFPGVLGTIYSLFKGTVTGSDNSTKGRTQDYGAVGEYFHQSRWFGRGFGTFIPSVYRTLDNQMLGTLVEGGLIGLLALVGLFVLAIRMARVGRRHATSLDDRVLGQAMVGLVAGTLAAAVTFDALGFPICAGTLFLTAGMCGAYRTIHAPEAPPRASVEPVPRLLAGVLAVIFAGVIASQVKSAPPSWISTASLATVGPIETGTVNPYTQPVVTAAINEILVNLVDGDQERAKLQAAGYTARYDLAVGTGSLEMGTDVYGTGPILHVKVQSTNRDATDQTVRAVVGELTSQLAALQDTAQVPTDDRMSVADETIAPAPYADFGSRKRGYAGALLLGIGAWIVFARILEQMWELLRRRTPESDTARSQDPRDPDVVSHSVVS